MKLVELQLEGFTSFREPAVLDLQEADLFAITGPTGAGKTSLLDAITFALFGIVERVGREVGHLISQNRAALKVLLTFEVSGERYRVTRRRPRKGAGTILFERCLTGEEWVNVGEGADRVDAVNARVEKLLGLDYEGFTRAVLLPQGQFAEFLHGDKKARRSILSKLLGLERIAELGAAARETSKNLKVVGDAKAEIANGSLADATQEILEERQAAMEEARARSVQLESLSDGFGALSDQANQVSHRHEQAVRAQSAIRALTKQLSEATQDQVRALAELETAKHANSANAEGEVKLRAAQQAAETDLAKHLKDLGQDSDIESARKTALDLAGHVRLAQDLESRLVKGSSLIESTRNELGALKERAAAATQRILDLESKLEEAQRELDQARRADHASAACEGLSPGDACPICATSLISIPETSAVAKSAAAKVEERRDSVEASRRAAAKDLADEATLVERLASMTSHRAELEIQLEAARALTEAGQRALKQYFEDQVSEDAATKLAAMLEHRKKLGLAVSQASSALSVALLASAEAEKGIARLEVHAQHAARRLVELREPARLPALGEHQIDVPTSLSDDFLAATDDALALNILEVQQTEATMLTSAQELAGDILGYFESVPEAIKILTEASKGAERALGASEESIRLLGKRIEERDGLQREIESLGQRADRFDELGRLLKGNEFISWLQEDALRGLCRVGTEHLQRLSGDRYRLEVDTAKDEFVVHDTWNGDEPRSARTLSGGETYLASLALALSLGDEVARMRIDASVKLETLLLDEGFGSLDHDSLDEVVEAIELLAASGRAVGIITHIEELARRMPVRFEVIKHESGSVVQRSQ